MHLINSEKPKQVAEHSSNQTSGDVCQKCKEKDGFIRHLNQCIQEQKIEIQMLQEMVGKTVEHPNH